MMTDTIPADDQLFHALQAKIRGRVPGFRIRYKNESWWQKLIGFFLFFNPKYMTRYTSTFRYTVWFPSRKFVNESRMRAFKILSHEYVHLLDRKKAPFFFELLYASPQFFVVFMLLAVLSIWFSNWWLMALASLVFVAPWPAWGRAVLEMRGYAMGMAINIWRHGDLKKATEEWIVEHFTGWDYYRMWPFSGDVNEWIEEYKGYISNIDCVGERGGDTIFDQSDAYLDVYELLTGIDVD
jgi:hypothetical protein